MRIACLSDLHGRLPKVPDCDLVVIAGDICPDPMAKNIGDVAAIQAYWLGSAFRGWLGQFDQDVPVVATWGNHDWVSYLNQPLERLPITWAVNEVVEVEVPRAGRKISIGGCPWTNQFFNWAWMLEPSRLNAYWNNFPKCDVLLSHGPPFGFLDNVPRSGPQGSKGLLEYIHREQPRLVVCGHIHEGYGRTVLNDGETLVINASVANAHGEGPNAIRVVEI